MALYKRLAVSLMFLVVAVLLMGCDSGSNLLRLFPTRVQTLVPQIVAITPHDTGAFTEGFVFHDNKLYESAGNYGKSSLREVDPKTGNVLRKFELPPQYFGEGIAQAGNRIIELTWHEQVAFIYDVNTFASLGTFSYSGEGWGLCFDGNQFFMSDGSSSLTVRDSTAFEVVRKITVTRDGIAVEQINELECVGDSIYANVWHTNTILQIAKANGNVTAVVDASGLLTSDETAAAGREGVLNGIAYDPLSDTFFITGKDWPKVFEVRFVSNNK